MYDRDELDPNASDAARAGNRQLHPPDLAERGRRVRLEAKALSNALGHTFGEAEGLLREQLRERPYAVIGLAAGLGYVLGGGLSGRMAMILGGVAGRMALAALVRNATDARHHVLEE